MTIFASLQTTVFACLLAGTADRLGCLLAQAGFVLRLTVGG
jgi:hypothetical protein